MCTRPSTPPRSTNAPNASSLRTRPSRSSPTLSVASISLPASCSARRSSWRRESTALPRPSSTEVTTNSSVRPTYTDGSAQKPDSICDMGQNPRTPEISTESPPEFTAVTRPETGAPDAFASRSCSQRGLACRLDRRREHDLVARLDHEQVELVTHRELRGTILVAKVPRFDRSLAATTEVHEHVLVPEGHHARAAPWRRRRPRSTSAGGATSSCAARACANSSEGRSTSRSASMGVGSIGGVSCDMDGPASSVRRIRTRSPASRMRPASEPGEDSGGRWCRRNPSSRKSSTMAGGPRGPRYRPAARVKTPRSPSRSRTARHAATHPQAPKPAGAARSDGRRRPLAHRRMREKGRDALAACPGHRCPGREAVHAVRDRRHRDGRADPDRRRRLAGGRHRAPDRLSRRPRGAGGAGPVRARPAAVSCRALAGLRARSPATARSGRPPGSTPSDPRMLWQQNLLSQSDWDGKRAHGGRAPRHASGRFRNGRQGAAEPRIRHDPLADFGANGQVQRARRRLREGRDQRSRSSP